MTTDDRRHEERAVYVISVAAELAGVHPQTLRIYERKGLLQPKRTSGNTRRYSQRDIDRLRSIQELTQSRGVNLAGVKMIMELQAQLDALQVRAVELEREIRRRQADAALRREPSAQIVPLHSVLMLPWQERTSN